MDWYKFWTYSTVKFRQMSRMASNNDLFVHKDFYIILLTNLSALRVPDEGYSKDRGVSTKCDIYLFSYCFSINITIVIFNLYTNLQIRLVSEWALLYHATTNCLRIEILTHNEIRSKSCWNISCNYVQRNDI
jgi:hypothetical protein